MAGRQMSEALRHLREALQGEGADRADGQLLEDYVAYDGSLAVPGVARVVVATAP